MKTGWLIQPNGEVRQTFKKQAGNLSSHMTVVSKKVPGSFYFAKFLEEKILHVFRRENNFCQVKSKHYAKVYFQGEGYL